MRPTEFALYGETLVIHVRRPGPVSPLGIATRAMRSPDIDCRRRERQGGDWLIHVFDKDGTERVYRIDRMLSDTMSSADILGQYRFEIDPEEMG